MASWTLRLFLSEPPDHLTRFRSHPGVVGWLAVDADARIRVNDRNSVLLAKPAEPDFAGWLDGGRLIVRMLDERRRSLAVAGLFAIAIRLSAHLGFSHLPAP